MDKVKFTSREVADKWAFFTIKVWKEKLWKYKILGKSLRSSFKSKISADPDGNVISIEFGFKYTGRFVDMGVGRGVRISDVRENKTSRYLEGKMLGNRRVAKKWYGKTFYHEVATLREIMARDFSHKGILQITEDINEKTISL